MPVPMTQPLKHLAILVAIELALAAPLLSQDQLVLISPHWEGVRTEFGNAFKRHYREETGGDVDLKWLDAGGTSDILKFVRSEFKAKPDGIGVDVMFGGGVDPFQELQRQEFLEPYRLPDDQLALLAPRINGAPLYDADYHWYAATMAGFGIIYNKVVLARLGLPEPRTWEDLARPELFTWVGSADPRKSGSVHMAYEIILQAYGWERGWQIITAMGANVRGFASYAGQTPKDVVVGEVAYGLTIDSYAWDQVREAGEEMIGYVMPQDLTVVSGDGIALIRGAPHLPTAQRFMRFVLSETGQKLWMLRLGEPDGPQKFELGKFSVMPAVYAQVAGRTPVTMDPFQWHSDFEYDATRGSLRWVLVNDLIGTFVIDPHRNLTTRWRRAIEAGNTDSALVALAQLPVSEKDVERLIASASWQSAAFRNRTLSEWGGVAREKYEVDTGIGDVARNLPAIGALVLGIIAVLYIRRHSGAAKPP